MNNENRIDNYFDRVKQNPPLIPIVKVNQIIVKAEVETKVETKKGHRNFLKFTIMTTILAVLISAVLIWPGNKAEDSNSRKQITEIATQSESGFAFQSKKTSERDNIQRMSYEKADQQNAAKNEIGLKETKEIPVINSLPAIDSNKQKYSNANAINKKDKATYSDSTVKRNPFDNLLADSEKNNNYTYPGQILDSTLFIELNRKELESLGFNFTENNIKLQFLNRMFALYTDNRLIFGVEFDDDSLSQNNLPSKIDFYSESLMILKNKRSSANYNEGIIPMLITDEKGKNLLQILVPEKDLAKMFSPQFPKDFRTLLPVIMKKNTFGDQPKEDLVYWFLPTDVFFNRLPQGISKELLGEYYYVVTEDKSTLEKPVCKYFEECKNTLKVSNFKVYPNPANNQATVSFTLPEAIEGRITLADLTGRERQALQPQTSFSKGSHQIDVDVSSVPEGIYLLTLYSDKGIQTQRLIVVR
jgi:hypothetical protein